MNKELLALESAIATLAGRRTEAQAMNKELLALESAIATLEMCFQSIEFSNELAAIAIGLRLLKSAKRVRQLAELCAPEDSL